MPCFIQHVSRMCFLTKDLLLKSENTSSRLYNTCAKHDDHRRSVEEDQSTSGTWLRVFEMRSNIVWYHALAHTFCASYCKCSIDQQSNPSVLIPVSTVLSQSRPISDGPSGSRAAHAAARGTPSRKPWTTLTRRLLDARNFPINAATHFNQQVVLNMASSGDVRFLPYLSGKPESLRPRRMCCWSWIRGKSSQRTPQYFQRTQSLFVKCLHLQVVREREEMGSLDRPSACLFQPAVGIMLLHFCGISTHSIQQRSLCTQSTTPSQWCVWLTSMPWMLLCATVTFS